MNVFEEDIDRFRIEVYPNKANAFAFFLIAVSLLFVFGQTIYWLYKVLPYSNLLGLIYIFMATFSLNFYFLARYFLKLMNSNGPVLELTFLGVQDYASPFQLGSLPVKDVRYFQIRDRFGVDYLKIKLRRSSRIYDSIKGYRRFIYYFFRFFWPKQILVPMILLDCTKIDLEARLLKFQALLQKNLTGGEEAEVTQFFKGQKEGQKEASDARISFPPLPDDNSSAASATKEPPAKNPILNRVREIKKMVSDSKFDQQMCDFFLDELRSFPAIQERNPSLLPEGLKNINTHHEGREYEEFVFRYKGHDYQIGLRRDASGNRNGVLTIGVDQKLKMSLRVTIEIGQLEPVELEVFLSGAWQIHLKALYEDIKERKRRGTPFSTVESQSGIHEYPDEDKELTELRKKFGIDDK